ncbi:hypothetical protein [Nocardiopsis salina]|uniref:hypothetical protein n=1 Tax=Nocardiopsis salina TaxID=245836 RepID=UPI000349725D|nr:hypothetical protein [Nocardiopsis salina]
MSEHVDLTDEATLVAALRLTRARIAEHREIEDAIVGKLKDLLGEATEARIGGAPVVTYRWTKPREQVDIKALREEQPEVAKQYTRLAQGSRRFVLLDPTSGEEGAA